MNIRTILAFFAVVLLTTGCYGDRRRGSSGSRGGDPGTSSRPMSGTPLCSNDCDGAYDGICDDGAAGAEDDYCDLGTDCSDCGTRYAPTTTDPGSDCECDAYTDSCDRECSCDPDCDDTGSMMPTGSAGLGDDCECASSTAEGFCASGDCGAGLSCFGFTGYGFCSAPCMAVGSGVECPDGSVCESIELDVGAYTLCAPT